MELNHPIITIREVAHYLRISEGQVRKAINGQARNAPKLPAIRIGRRVMVLRESLLGWILEAEAGATQNTPAN